MDGRILVVDDERDICDILRFNLEGEGYDVDVAFSGEEALGMISGIHRLVILDVMMGGISGFELAERLRRGGNPVPVLFLTARSAEDDLLTGFSLGGDDYVSKPFSVKEVLVRVRALLKRTLHVRAPAEGEGATVWRFRGLRIDPADGRVRVDGVEVSLTRKEFEILSLLARTSPQMLPRAEILHRVWGDREFVLDRTVDVHITRLRKKLGDYGGIIVNRSGFGYYLHVDAEEVTGG
ncbi:MAG: response regulator transcription factor [Proteiniphilum sp.]|jgi:DNA-binding response OmpR family regulator|nr:response regulator transcription factor [Proteiniphilum sp.]